MEKLAIVAIGYNRAEAFHKMLNSLNVIKTERRDISLVLTLEGGATQEVVKIANEYVWNYGEKIIVKQKERLGLRNHFIWVGDQTETYENVIFLEDDLSVSPYIIDTAEKFIEMYEDDERIAAGSFYSPLICEFTSNRFYTVDDGSDVYFFQHPYWGNLWQKEKWRRFKEWYATYERKEEILPKYIRGWKKTSFKVVYIQYLIETNRYVVFPRHSYVNNMGFAGLHNQSGGNSFQVPYVIGKKELYCKSFDDAIAIYDANFEITEFALKKANPSLAPYHFDVDLNKTGDNHTSEYILTFGKSKNPIMEFYGAMKPYELAPATNQKGSGIVLSRRCDMIRQDTPRKLWYYDFLNNNVVSDRRLLYYLLDSSCLMVKRVAQRLKIIK